MSQSLKTRVANHLLCEELAYGAIMTRDYTQLKTELVHLQPLVKNDWGLKCQDLIVQREAVERSKARGGPLADWEQFISVIVFWPMDGDVPSDFSCTQPMNRFTSADTEHKASQFKLLVEEHVLKPPRPSR